MRFCGKKDPDPQEPVEAGEETPKPKRRRADAEDYDVSNAEPHGGKNDPPHPHLFQL